MKKVLSIFGTRPEAIKMSPLIKRLESSENGLESTVCVTAQHREMLDQILTLFDIQPTFDLNIMKKGQDLHDITARIIQDLKAVIKEVKPDLVLVHGDTTTSMVAALAAFYQQVPVGHVEAGLRTFNPMSPFPEEINRQITARIATYHFCPTPKSKENLEKEGIHRPHIYVTGNTGIDALHAASDLIEEKTTVKASISRELEKACGNHLLDFEKMKYILVTGHRRENFGEGINNICKVLIRIAERFPDFHIIYPVHLNPNIWGPVHQLLKPYPTIILTSPLDYLPFIYLMKNAYLVLTDSGGIQEEAPSFGKPVLVTRNTTERPEAIEAGTAALVGTDPETIFSKISSLLLDHQAYLRMSQAVNPYGDGKAAARIVEIIERI